MVRRAAALYARKPSILTAACLLLVGCTSEEDVEPAGGTYALVRYNGEAVPLDQGALPRRCPPFTDDDCDPFAPPFCHQILTEGTLSLDPARMRFDVFYLTRNSCGAHVLSRSHSTGSYEQSQRLLTLQVDGLRPIRYSGVVDGNSVSIHFGDGEDVTFDRSLPAQAAQIAGTFQLIGLRNEILPVNEDGAPTELPGCTIQVDSGALLLEPATGLEPETGRFSLSYRLVDSCSGELQRWSDETGTYEQVVSSLVFVAEHGPNTVRLFGGLIKETEIVLHIAGENDLIFSL